MTTPPWRPTHLNPRLTRRLAVPWTDFARSTPLADFAAALAELRRFGLGQGGCDGTFVWMNRATFRLLQGTTNDRDLYGRRCSRPFMHHIVYINMHLVGDDLPAIEITPGLPDGVAVMSEPGRRGVLLRAA